MLKVGHPFVFTYFSFDSKVAFLQQIKKQLHSFVSFMYQNGGHFVGKKMN